MNTRPSRHNSLLRRFPAFGIIFGLLCASQAAAFPVERAVFELQKSYLKVEVLDEDLIHFELAGKPLSADDPIGTTLMVAKSDYTGVSAVAKTGPGEFETDQLMIIVDPGTLTVSVSHKASAETTLLASFSAKCSGDTTTISIDAPQMSHAYGLGEQFFDPPSTSANWVGRQRTPGCEFGNRQVPYLGGAVGNNTFPILYALGDFRKCFAIFVDDIHAQSWDLSSNPWQVKVKSPSLRWYFLAGPKLPDLRSDYMELIGRPPVPPKKAFGLWVSEYGFENWAELESKLKSLREHNFPVDGFVLDLQWFGGLEPGGENSKMGHLSWDTKQFPRARAKINKLAKDSGVGLVLIEESYIARGLPEHRRLAKKGYLVSDKKGDPIFLKSWWGHGGMIDWLNPAAGDFWHDKKRSALIADGVLGHWTDLGEPEDFSRGGVYGGILPEADAHNLYNLSWAQSIARGYSRNKTARRPWILSRSGISGIQRYGAAMWSGDIGSNIRSLGEQFIVQANMSLSGVDYFGSDIGGFHRSALDGDLDELYTMWFADSAAIDVPVRPHTSNKHNKYETAPDRVGDMASNLANIRLRYQLIPYLYSLAHRAYRTGDPVFPPLFYYFPQITNERDGSEQKMIGDSLMVVLNCEYGDEKLAFVLPEDTWFEWYHDTRIDAPAAMLGRHPPRSDGLLTLPLYARAGAIIPMMYVDDQTMNAVGMRKDGSRRDELILRVFAGGESSFTLYEDDGETTAYQHGEVRTTKISQETTADGVTVSVDGSKGEFEGAPNKRANIVRLTTDGRPQCSGVTLNGMPLPRIAKAADFETALEGWFQPDRFVIIAKSKPLPVDAEKTLSYSLTAD